MPFRHRRAAQSKLATKFITRGQALRKLQLSLSDFRRLCILKGVFPRDLSTEKKPKKGTNTTFYSTKDIRFLAHEPLLGKFQAMKTHARRLTKALAKKQPGIVQTIRDQQPVVKVDHIVRERYPTFIDALRDLDDCLCLVFLFANLPQLPFVAAEMTQKCKRLADEFMMFVVHARALRKVFLSIKGIYYQAEIQGQTITWIVPYRFNTVVGNDVDYKVMSNFLLLYTTMLTFVNFKLYTSMNLKYPPTRNEDREKSGEGISALSMQPSVAGQDGAGPTGEKMQISAQTVQKALKALREEAAAEAGKEATAPATDAPQGPAHDSTKLDEFPDQMPGGEEAVPGVASIAEQQRAQEQFTRLFEGLVFFLNREVPRYSLEFVIRAFGGQVSWEAIGDDNAGPYAASDPKITHHVVDRPKLAGEALGNRHYIQPQWVYDCINAQELLPTADYAVGAVLPPHLSPFAKEGDDDYIPPERLAQLSRAQETHAADVMAEELGEENGPAEDEEGGKAANGKAKRAKVAAKEKEEEEEEEEEEQHAKAAAVEEDDDDALYRKELAAEMRGDSTDLTMPSAEEQTKKQKRQQKKEQQKRAEESNEATLLSKAVMKGKDRRVYNAITRRKGHKQHFQQQMKERRKAIEKIKKGDDTVKPPKLKF